MEQYKKLREYLEELISSKEEEFKKGTKTGGKGIDFIVERKNKLDNLINIFENGNYNEVDQQKLFEDMEEILNFIFNYNHENNTGVKFILEYLQGCLTILKFDGLEAEQIEYSKKFINEIIELLNKTIETQKIKLATIENQLQYEIAPYKQYLELIDENGLKRGLTEEEYIVFSNFIKRSNLDDSTKISLLEGIIKSNYKFINQKAELQKKLLLVKISDNASKVLSEADNIILEEETPELSETSITPENESVQEPNNSTTAEDSNTNQYILELTEEEKEIIEKITDIIDELKKKYNDIEEYKIDLIDNLISNQTYNLNTRKTIYESNEQEKWKIILYDLIKKIKVEFIKSPEEKEELFNIYKYIISEYNKYQEKSKIVIPKLSIEQLDKIKNIVNLTKPLVSLYNELSEQEKNLIETIYINSGIEGFKPEDISPKYSISYIKTIKDSLKLLSKLDDYDQHLELLESLSTEEISDQYIKSIENVIKEINEICERLNIEYNEFKNEQKDLKTNRKIEKENPTEQEDASEIDLDLLPLNNLNNYIIFLDELVDEEYKEEDYQDIIKDEKRRIVNVGSSLNRMSKKDGNQFQTNQYGLSEPVLGVHEQTLKPRATRTGATRTGFIVASISQENKQKIFSALQNPLSLNQNIKNSRIFIVIGYARKYGDKEIYQQKFNDRISKSEKVIKDFQKKLKAPLSQENVLQIVSMIQSSYQYLSDLIVEGKKIKGSGQGMN